MLYHLVPSNMITESFYWFSDDNMTICFANKASYNATFIKKTTLKSIIPIKEIVTSDDWKSLGYKNIMEINLDTGLVKKISSLAHIKFKYKK